MARTTVVTVTDDLDGTQSAGTIRFGIDGSQYEIDLSQENEQTLRKTLEPYIKASRAISGTPKVTRPSPRASNSGPDAADVRAWAVANGVEVSSRGRISRGVIAQYQAFLAAPTAEAKPKRARRKTVRA